MENKPSRSDHNATRSSVGPRSTGGMASEARTGATAHLGLDVPKVFDSKGTIGKQFTTEGAIGGTAQKIGGPFSEDGIIGHRFTTDGIVGASVQGTLGGKKRSAG
ncbi:hypothetical protein V8F20_004022 [Naviculisporaceae sp. PSN 640]